MRTQLPAGAREGLKGLGLLPQMRYHAGRQAAAVASAEAVAVAAAVVLGPKADELHLVRVMLVRGPAAAPPALLMAAVVVAVPAVAAAGLPQHHRPGGGAGPVRSNGWRWRRWALWKPWARTGRTARTRRSGLTMWCVSQPGFGVVPKHVSMSVPVPPHAPPTRRWRRRQRRRLMSLLVLLVLRVLLVVLLLMRLQERMLEVGRGLRPVAVGVH